MTRSASEVLRRLSLVLVPAALTLLLASCGDRGKVAAPPASKGAGEAASPAKKAGEGAPAAKAPVDSAGSASAEATCTQIDIGDHEFLGDLDFDPATGAVVLTVTDHSTGKPFPHTKAEAVLNLVLASGTAQVKMAADPLPEDPEGKSSRYTLTDAALKGQKGLKGRVNLTIDGKLYVCDLASGH